MNAALKFTKEDLIFLATRGDTVGIRESAAESLYQRGRVDGAQEVGDAIGVSLKKPAEAVRS